MYPHFKPIPAIFYACFSRDLYRDVFLRWQGLGFTYLLLLNIVLITPVLVYLLFTIESAIFNKNGDLQPQLQTIVDQVTAQVPEMRFEEGKLHTDVEQPYSIHMGYDGEVIPLAVIDLDAKMEDVKEGEALFLLTRDMVHTRHEHKIESMFWSEFGNDAFVVNADIAQQAANDAVDWAQENKGMLFVTFGLMLWVGTVLVMFLYRAAQVLVFGGAAMLIARILKVHMQYGDAVRLSCLAITAPLLIDLILGFLLGNGISLLLFIALTLGYLVFAIHSNQTLEPDADNAF